MIVVPGEIPRVFFVFTLVLIFSSLDLPGQELPEYYVSPVDSESPGFYFLTPRKVGSKSEKISSYHLILDGAGKPVYYKTFGAKENSIDFKIHNNGLISYYSNEKICLMDSSFKVVDSVFCKNNVSLDPHDFLILANGHYLLLGYENITMNLSKYRYFNNNQAGSDTAKVKCNIIQELDAHKNVVFQWHSKDHYKFEDVDVFYLNDPNKIDWTHFNSIAVDSDGNLLVSARNFDEVTKINRTSGEIMWRLGGKQNQFKFTNDSAGFVAQHAAAKLENGAITLLDNGRAKPQSHLTMAKEYRLDHTNKTAELVWSYTDPFGSDSEKGLGNVQRLSNGNTLVNPGIKNNSKTMFVVVNPKGDKTFEVAFKDSLRSYRVFYYPTLPFKLNRPQITSFTKDGKIYLDAGDGYQSYQWSNGEKNRIIAITAPGVYSVFVPIGNGGFISSTGYTIKDL